ncbi:hypothetical protein ACFQ68_28290 [Amycolatopsis japonica]|uniref:hypothetical protein n=1 Tax=Amycolatopsis japonica TaxID=208439 RepID=UPI00366DC74E
MTSATGTGRQWTRGEIAKLTQAELAEHSDDLIAAAKEGRITDDRKPDGSQPHPSGKPWIRRSEIAALTQVQLAERVDELEQAAAENRIIND